jgi:hypothetical protein
MANKYHGQGGRIYMSTTAAGTATVMVSLSSWSLDLSTDKVEVTAFESTNKEYVQGKKDITGEFSGFWDSSDDSLFDGAESTDGVKIYIYPSKDAPTIYHYGTAWLDASLEGGVDSAVAVSGTFVAAGAWGRKPA